MTRLEIVGLCSGSLKIVGAFEMKKDYKEIYKKYHASPDAIKKRSMRNKARRLMNLKVGDEREVDHKNPLSKGGTNNKRNLRVVTRATNRKKGAK